MIMAESGIEKWHGINREEIEWFPSVDNGLCIGCGVCVLGCGPHVFDFDFENKKSVVTHPYRCKVGCVTCANTCPTHAIAFPSLTYLHSMYKGHNVLNVSRSELDEKRDKYYVRHEEKSGTETSTS